MEEMEEKEKILSAPCSPKDMKSSDPETLLRILAEKDAEILKLKAELVSCQGQLAIAFSENEKLQAKITDVDVAPQQVEMNIDNVRSVSVSVQVPEESHNTDYGDKPMPKWNDGGDANSASIADILKETAEGEIENQGRDSSQQLDETNYEENQMNSEYIFDSNSGFYYHPATGYYWDPNSGLFYDYTSGLYYWYDEKTQAYEVHSSVDCHEGSNSSPDKLTVESRCENEVENLTSQLYAMDLDPKACRNNALAMAEDYPPCIRFIVQESESLPRGDLYIVTCSGGSIGREASIGHALLIPDTSVSKRHAEIVYDYDEFCYKIKDLGSQNGTLINKHRLSQSKKKSLNHILSHDDVLQVGNDTKLLAHIHKGHETCEDCEPGQVQAKLKAQNQIKNTFTVLSKEERRIQQRQELKRIKKKFGLQNSYYESPGSAINNSGYEDKAMIRRKVVGSENDKGREENPASVYSPITASNKGHKLLAKMGWKEGEGLGKSSTGIAEPINVELRLNQGAGLGSDVSASLSMDNLQQANKVKRWNQARQRFHKVMAESESKESHNSPNEAKTPLNLPGALNPIPTVHSHPTDNSSFPSVSHQMSRSPSSSSVVNKESVMKPSHIVWVKGETQEPS